MRFLQDADELFSCLAPLCEGTELLEDVLDQLHIVFTHRLQFWFLKALMGLGYIENTDVNTIKEKLNLKKIFYSSE